MSVVAPHQIGKDDSLCSVLNPPFLLSGSVVQLMATLATRIDPVPSDPVMNSLTRVLGDDVGCNVKVNGLSILLLLFLAPLHLLPSWTLLHPSWWTYLGVHSLHFLRTITSSVSRPITPGSIHSLSLSIY